jgi:hypothetical protein
LKRKEFADSFQLVGGRLEEMMSFGLQYLNADRHTESIDAGLERLGIDLYDLLWVTGKLANCCIS